MGRLASRKNLMFVDFVEGQTIKKYFLEIERWDIRMHLLYCLRFRMFMVINKLDMKNVKAKDKLIEKYFLDIERWDMRMHLILFKVLKCFK